MADSNLFLLFFNYFFNYFFFFRFLKFFLNNNLLLTTKKKRKLSHVNYLQNTFIIYYITKTQQKKKLKYNFINLFFGVRCLFGYKIIIQKKNIKKKQKKNYFTVDVVSNIFNTIFFS